MPMSSALETRHRHGRHVHTHPSKGQHRHLVRWQPSRPVDEALGNSYAQPHDHTHHDHEHAYEHPHDHEHRHDHEHPHDHREHGHSHGLVDRSILRSREGLKAVGISLGVLGLAAIAQQRLIDRIAARLRRPR